LSRPIDRNSVADAANGSAAMIESRVQPRAVRKTIRCEPLQRIRRKRLARPRMIWL